MKNLTTETVLNTTINYLNEVIQSVPLSLFSHLGDVVDLKLHEASYYAASQEDIPYAWFLQWAEDIYEFEYSPFLKDKKVEIQAIPSSNSKFYLTPQDSRLFELYDLDTYSESTLEERRALSFETFLYYYFNIRFEYEGDIIDGQVKAIYAMEEALKEPLNSIEALWDETGLKDLMNPNLQTQFKSFCEEILTDLEKVYTYIEAFKENQLTLFKEYVDCRKADCESI